jgi:hypothetical protein
MYVQASKKRQLQLAEPHPVLVSCLAARPHHLTSAHPLRSPPPRDSAHTTTMPLPRPNTAARLITTPRARLQIVTQARRPFSATTTRSAGDHAHEDHYDPPTGWLFGVKPGEKYENEGWENVWFYGFGGCLLFGVIGYCYKPDTR